MPIIFYCFGLGIFSLWCCYFSLYITTLSFVPLSHFSALYYCMLLRFTSSVEYAVLWSINYVRVNYFRILCCLTPKGKLGHHIVKQNGHKLHFLKIHFLIKMCWLNNKFMIFRISIEKLFNHLPLNISFMEKMYFSTLLYKNTKFENKNKWTESFFIVISFGLLQLQK